MQKKITHLRVHLLPKQEVNQSEVLAGFPSDQSTTVGAACSSLSVARAEAALVQTGAGEGTQGTAELLL